MKTLLSSQSLPQTYLRISVTDRCNLRCGYCMPPGGKSLVEHSDLLTFEELGRAVNLLASMGVSKVRVTGGEPLVRRGLPALLEKIAKTPGVSELCLTTNGTLLEGQASRIRDAGVKRLNVSIDSLDRECYERITGYDMLLEVMRGLDEARNSGFGQIKVNTVLFRGLNDGEAAAFIRTSGEWGLTQRFIELMPFRMPASLGVPESEVRALVAAAVLDATGVEFISQMTRPFCADCRRLRIDAKGRLKACLLSGQHLDLRGLLRGGADDATVAESVRSFVLAAEKRLAEDPHHWEARAAALTMNEIGG